MLRSRIVVVLLLDGEGLVKTLKFGPDKYVGDPLNAIKIFNEKNVDELVFLDISATHEKRLPNYDLITRLSRQCRMPISYGGGIDSLEKAQTVIQCGVEKIVVGESAVANPEIVNQLTKSLGSSTVTVVINYRKGLTGKNMVFTKNGRTKTKLDANSYAIDLANRGAGELILYNIGQDGVRKGYDFSLCDELYDNISCPLTLVGGVGSVEHFREALQRYSIIGLGSGSFFTLVGKLKAVLINYSRP